MSSTHTKQCPICDSTCLSTETVCTKCGWDLTINHDCHLDEKILQKIQTVTRNVYQKFRRLTKRYRQERNELKTQMDEIKDLPKQMFQLQLHASKLKKENDRLKQEIEKLQVDKLKTQIEQFDDKKSKDKMKVEENIEQHSIVQDYQNTDFLMKNGIKVTPTKKTLKDIYLNTVKEIIFYPAKGNDYWIVELESGIYGLLPNENLDIKRNLKAIRYFFELIDYDDNSTSTCKVIKLAQVEKINID